MGVKAMDPAILQNQYPVCILHAGNTLCNDNLCRPRYFCLESPADIGVGSCIYRTCGIVKDQYFRFL